MRLIQFQSENGLSRVARSDRGSAEIIADTQNIVDLAHSAIASGQTIAAIVEARGYTEQCSLVDLVGKGLLLPPLGLPDPARIAVTGTGLTHIGSAEARDAMHRVMHGDDTDLSDSMKIFRMGLEGGKPQNGQVGCQPEWFYKGDGRTIVAPGSDLVSPSFALAAAEEPEIVGIYLIAPDGTPWRLGFALANDFSDHVTEQTNYLYLAHSKLRPCSVGPELLLGDLPDNISGMSRIIRGGNAVWEAPFLSGEANMSHSIANLEHHHFRYDRHRIPGDMHVHFFGCPVMSFAQGFIATDGDVFEADVEAFGLALRNRLRIAPPEAVRVQQL